VVNFGDDYYLDQDFTDNVAKLRAALERVDTGEARRCTTHRGIGRATFAEARFRSEFFWCNDGNDNASQESLKKSCSSCNSRTDLWLRDARG